ncbi:Lrp/AsnC family transcriptional regulator [Acuticoccus sp. M5D2P5]|uniref:Lrp/AsnC family transcriptional regulator n=1 Tax=Acuticoccus kalidii TaxID=2910977 RepID=UPI001F20EFF2|nr:Lrp/AsnC family transcriptional regulator [Acuticoccus kalidii]MCF3936701.1 Lrp/AsnC family transcriptional regulator [Acuticoccus kalidii]
MTDPRLDQIDRRILDLLQEDATLQMNEIAERVGLSPSPCWRRVRRMERDGLIRRRVALLDRAQANVALTVFMAIRAQHSRDWLVAFRNVIADIPEVVEAYRLTGEIDYMLRIVVPDVAKLDEVYNLLISKIDFAGISSSIAMEEMKYTTAVPTKYLVER